MQARLTTLFTDAILTSLAVQLLDLPVTSSTQVPGWATATIGLGDMVATTANKATGSSSNGIRFSSFCLL
jgi:hypothetical protein